ncbi:MAG: hypothetical protein GXO71_02390 [Caldiserica bacterium]|nr:hypothetical protein [Caldisericota bacterium]
MLQVLTPDVKVKETRYQEGGKHYLRVDYETPEGNFYSLQEDRGYTRWTLQHLFSGPEDYAKLIFFFQNHEYRANYDYFARMEKLLGEDIILRGSIGLEPLQAIIELMGTETFCFEWMERRDEVLNLYAAILEARRRSYPLLSESPCLHFNYGGNVTVEIVGLEGFRKYYLPNYEEAAEYLHKYGKLIGSHFDANCRLIAADIAESSLDFIEAFTPAPDTDLTLKEAISFWKGKALWINFPSSVHLKSKEKIAEATIDLLEEAEGYPRFLIGITEDVPEDRWQGNFLTIMETIEKYFKN